MDHENHSFFRKDALQHYLREREESVLPRLVAPPTFIFLWILVLLLIGAVTLASFSRVPLYVPGKAIIVSGRCMEHKPCGPSTIIALLPPDSLPSLHVGEAMFLEIEGNRNRVRTSVMHVDPEIQSPQAIREKFALDKSLAGVIDHPAAIAVAQWVGGSEGYAGSILPVQVEFGSRRLLSLLGRSNTGHEYYSDIQ